MKHFTNLEILLMSIIFVSLIILFINYCSTKYNKKDNFENSKVMCHANGFPNKNNHNIFFKLHEELKQKRDLNHLLSRKTNKSNFIFPEKGPSNIFIIRHGEKIKGKVALDSNGILRSTYIPTLIDDLNKKGYGFHNIITANDYNSMHQEQTVLLTSWLYSIPLFIYGDYNDPEITVKTLFKNKYFHGKTILICWEHNCIQTLLKCILKIGSKEKSLKNYTFKNPEGTSEMPYWDTNNYKSIYHLDNNLNFYIYEENFTTCFSEDNNVILYGKKQKCK